MHFLQGTQRRVKLKFEIKYIMRVNDGLELLDRLSGHMRLDMNASKERVYHNCSLYYDSPDLKYYRETIEGYMVRKKFSLKAIFSIQRPDLLRS